MRFAVLLSIFVAPGSAWAHRLIIDVVPSPTTIRVDAYFDDDTPADSAKVSLSADGVSLAESKTDERGRCTLTAPPPGQYVVRVEAFGHAATAEITVPATIETAPATDPVDPPGGPRSGTETRWFRLGLGLGIVLMLTLISMRKRGRSAPPSP